MNPCDPLEHFLICADCGSVILGTGECRECPVETVQVPGFLIFGVLAVLGGIVLVNIVLVIGYLDWSHYFTGFGHFLKGGK